jgi:large subunit ribosomal protein L1
MKMSGHGKRYKAISESFDKVKLYPADEAIDLVLANCKAKFNETIEMHIKLGIDPRKSDQNVRGTVVLPHGTGKTPRVIVFTKGDKAKEAEEAKADKVGAEDLIELVKGGWAEFEVAVASPEMMGQLGKELGKILGPRMPNPKAGTVTKDIGKTVKELKSGKVQYRADKLGIIHSAVGKKSFEKEKLSQNIATLLDAVIRAKPPTAKGAYLRSIVLTSTMGAGVKLDTQKAALFAQGK